MKLKLHYNSYLLSKISISYKSEQTYDFLFQFNLKIYPNPFIIPVIFLIFWEFWVGPIG